MPDWFADALRHVPGIAVGLGVGWYVGRMLVETEKRHAAERRTDHDRLIAAKDEMIAELFAQIETLRGERDRWMRSAIRRRKS